ncbi:hypothetical protein H8S23_01130 [Anaerofilum sp. BX8]|uniref:Glycosyl hydrolase family 13 catalytic domain-containing protein n=1 Tax=Anaerofilum hominis TaxID=2763016 RepID=A0A923KX63_9FIRM|nr:alpha-amylase family glycosyl hydrolase [Anaerofilum hominis]MBC5580104.1 hypothetical protein [Anaerofilum hominis]
MAWYEKSVFYQIYPLGFCGAPWQNDGVTRDRILKVRDWIPHLTALGADAVYFSPVFESDTHGYNTRDYAHVDCRLGGDDAFAQVCAALHAAGVRVVLDGVFNHVGRGFWAFQDVLQHRRESRYASWFHLNFEGDSPYHDGLWYEGWEGNYDLVKLNLDNPEVVDHLLGCVEGWISAFEIDGLRLDVAYLLPEHFLRRLRAFCDGRKADFFLVGEMIHGDYNRLVQPDMLHSATNYECYKGLHSSFNSGNMFEIAHSLARQFGPENWTLYRGKHLFNFVDNHDVSRIASLLSDKRQLPCIYGLLFAMPGIPCLYYGSEWGAEGEKRPGGDENLRPAFDAPQKNELTAFLARLSAAHKNSAALTCGDYKNIQIMPRQLIFQRQAQGERVLVAVNADSAPATMHFDAGAGRAVDLISGAMHDFGGGSELPPYSVAYWRVE